MKYFNKYKDLQPFWGRPFRRGLSLSPEHNDVPLACDYGRQIKHHKFMLNMMMVTNKDGTSLNTHCFKRGVFSSSSFHIVFQIPAKI